MSNEYAKYLAKHRANFIKLSNAQERELARLYIEAASEIKQRAELIIEKKGLSFAQSKIRIKSLLLEADRLSDGFKKILDKSLIDSAGLGTEVNKIILSKYQASLKKEGINLKLTKILSKVNPEAVKSIYNRIWTDGLKLSDRVWLLDRRTKQEIERIVMQNIISGGAASNRVTLSALENLLNPGYKPAKLTSLHGRKVGVEASRLLRTSTAEAFNEGDRLSALKNPGVIDQTVLTTAGACEICAPKEGKSVKEEGYPTYHPNCTCSTLDVVESIEAFTDRWISFMKNPDSQPDLGKWLLEVYQKAA